jgi:hypothetical protein
MSSRMCVAEQIAAHETEIMVAQTQVFEMGSGA